MILMFIIKVKYRRDTLVHRSCGVCFFSLQRLARFSFPSRKNVTTVDSRTYDVNAQFQLVFEFGIGGPSPRFAWSLTRNLTVG